MTRVFQKTARSNKRFIINVGGARSTKSYSIAQLLIKKFFEEDNIKVLVTRKTFPALRQTAYKVIMELFGEYGLLPYVTHNKSEHSVTYEIVDKASNRVTNRCYMLFTSIDDPEKIKSTEWNYIWMEEANEFNYEDFIVLKTRLSAKNINSTNKLYMSFNPVDEQTWIKTKIMDEVTYGDETEIIHSTYKDNPTLSKQYIADLEALISQDATFYKIYTLGEFATPINIIYKRFIVIPESQFSINFDDSIYGLDFGFNNPTAVIKIDFKDNLRYLTEELYQTKLTNGQLIEKLKDIIPDRHRNRFIYGDNAEPQRIQEIRDAGFNILPAHKAVNDGIDFCKRQTYYTNHANIRINEENKLYKWKEDKNGNVLDEPVKFKDHGMDAIRYADYTHHLLHGRKIENLKSDNIRVRSNQNSLIYEEF